VKEADLITAPDYMVIKAAEDFKDNTTAIFLKIYACHPI
tara:strand:- start:2317 stop:2433 length:117 start_codon:yes stop_codon:yes gene_type:complete